MKKLVLAIALAVSSLSVAQQGEAREKMTPEQRVDNQLKEMTANLNLTEKQQAEVKTILVEQSKKREAKRTEMKAARERGEQLTDQQRAQMKKDLIDEQLEMKTKMKKILTEEQLKKMKEMRREKGMQMSDKKKAGRKAVKKED